MLRLSITNLRRTWCLANPARGVYKPLPASRFTASQQALPVVTCQRCFHTTSRRDVHPLLWMVIKPFAKIFSIVSGRYLRRWWAGLPAGKKQEVLTRLNLSQHKILLACGLLVTAGAVNYATHLQETPVTHRKRFIAFTPAQFEKIMQLELQTIMEKTKDAIVKTDSPLYSRIERVVKRLTAANQDLQFIANQKWKIIVINSPEQNAFVLPSGEIFVFSGLFDMITNDDQLAVVIGHEMSHAVLNHGAERVSYAQLLDVLIIIAMAGIWFFMPTDGLAFVTQWFYHKVVQLLLSLPYDRKLETEADVVGLQLMAKACYDVRESTHFWQLMSIRAEAATQDGQVELPEWLSTHPSNDKRANNLNSLVPQALDMREHCKCPPLKSKDPADGIMLLKQIVNQIVPEEK